MKLTRPPLPAGLGNTRKLTGFQQPRILSGRRLIGNIIDTTVAGGELKDGVVDRQHIVAGAVSQVVAALATTPGATGDVVEATITRNAGTKLLIDVVLWWSVFTGTGNGAEYTADVSITRDTAGDIEDNEHFLNLISWDAGVPAVIQFGGNLSVPALDEDDLSTTKTYTVNVDGQDVDRAFIRLTELY